MKSFCKRLSFTVLSVISLSFVICKNLSAQTGQPVSIDGTTTNFSLGHPGSGGHAVAVDKAGNTIYTGTTNGTVDFDPGAGVNNQTNSYTAGGLIYLAKYDINGNLLWVNTFGSTKNSATYTDVGVSVKTDASDNIYLAVNFYGTVDFDPSPGTVRNLVAGTGNPDAGLIKYTPEGAFIWALNVGGSSSLGDMSSGLFIDNSNVFLSGTLSAAAIVTDGTGATSAVPSGGVYVMKASALTGSLTWIRTAEVAGGSGAPIVQVAANASGEVYVTGGVRVNTIFGKGQPSAITGPTSATSLDGFLWKLTSAGANTYVRFFEGDNNYLTLDGNENVVITGRFTGTSVDLDPGAATQLKTSSSADIYVLKANASDGAAQWILTAGGTGFDNGGLRITTDASNNIYVGAAFANPSASFPIGAGSVTLTSAGSTDIAIWKISPTGTGLWIKQIGSAFEDEPRAINVYGEYIRVSAIIRGQVDLDPSSAGTLLTSTNTFPSLASVTWTSAGELGTAVVLPVKLIGFDASSQPDHSVRVSWKTTQEVNNSHFILERSADGRNFTYLARLAGKGTFEGVSSYVYTDKEPLAGNNYYRLKQYDLDGRTNEYEMKLVKISSNAVVYKVSPNPVVGSSLTIYRNTSPGNDLSYRIVDMKGIMLKAGKVLNREEKISIDGFAKGLYFIQLSDGEVLKFQRD